MIWKYHKIRQKSGKERKRSAHRFRVLLAVVWCTASTSLYSGCSGVDRYGGAVTVEGVVTVRGNVPFNVPILETENRNFYVLVLTRDQLEILITPARFRATGRVYLDDWNGRPIAHLEAYDLTSLGG